MTTRNQTNVEFRNEVHEILARHESSIGEVHATLQTVLAKLQSLRMSHRSQASPSEINPFAPSDSSHAKPVLNSLPNKVAPLSPGTRVLPPSVPCKINLDERLKELPKITVKFFLHASGNIAAKFPYDQAVVGAVRKIPKATWYAKERLWMFPITSLSSAEKVLHETSGVNVELFKQLEALYPDVYKSVQKPLRYYNNNLIGTFTLLDQLLLCVHAVHW